MKIIHTLRVPLIICFLLTACSSNLPLANPVVPQSQKTTVLKKNIAHEPYTGPIDLKINTGLRDGSNGKIVDLSILNSEDDFNIKSIPDGSIVFQETFTQERSQLEETRTIKIPDTSKRYTLHVERQPWYKLGQATVNINGHDWVKPEDFKWFLKNVTQDHLLLNANNSLRVNLKGPKGSGIKVTLIEGGQAETVKSRNRRNPNETHASRVASNDINIFDPNDSNSLGGLEPFEGDFTIPTDVEGRNYSVGKALINGTDDSTFESGKFIVKLAEPVSENLLALDDLYDIAVEQMLDSNTFLLKFDVDNFAVQNAIELIQHYNTGIETNLKQLEFSSPATLKTFVIVLDIIKNHLDLVENVSLNIVADSPSTLPNDWDFQGGGSFGKSWWLSDTNVLDAWKYSDGKNARVAFIDDGGFALNHPEIMYDLNPTTYRHDQSQANIFGELNILGSFLQIFPIEPLKNWHGHYSAMVGFAKQNNGIKTVGVSPESQVIPFQANTVLEYMAALSTANICLNPTEENLRRVFNGDPEGLSQATTISNGNFSDSLVDKIFSRSCGFDSTYNAHNFQVMLFNKSFKHYAWYDSFWVNPFDDTKISLSNMTEFSFRIGRAIGSGITVVAPAQNEKQYVGPAYEFGVKDSFWYPANDSRVISVGAVDVNPSFRQIDENGFAIPGKESLQVEQNSNYGSKLVWAPGGSIVVSDHENPQKTRIVSGTSAAASFIAGVVSLMKSIDPNLSSSEIQTILKNSETLSALGHPQMQQAGFSQVKVIDVEKAVSAVASRFTPYITSVAPTQVKRDELTQIVLRGQNFQSDSQVIIDNSPGILPFIQADKTLIQFSIPANSLSVGEHSLIVKSSLGNSNKLVESNRITFNVTASGAGGGFAIQRQSQPTALFTAVKYALPLSPSGTPVLPPGINVFMQNEKEKLYVNPGDVVGLGLEAADLSQIRIEIDGQSMSLKSIAKNYVTYEVSHNLSPGIKDVIIRLAGDSVTLEDAIEIFTTPRLQEIQSIDTRGALRLDAFSDNGEDYIVLGNGGLLPLDFHQTVEIMRWDGNQMVPHQTIPANGPYDVDVFTMNDEQYLIVGEYFDNSQYTIDSHLYKWNGNQFVAVQSIATTGIIGWEHFSIDNQHYLLSSNFVGPGYSFTQPSVLYQWNGTQFNPIQQIATQGARDWEHIEIDGQHFFAVAEEQAGISLFRTQTQIFRWQNGRLEPFQTVPASGARDWEGFTLNGESYLALANVNYQNSGSYATPTQIFRWDGTQFVVDRSFPYQGAGWEYAMVNDRHYLMLSAYDKNSQTPNASVSKLYRWNGMEWILNQEIVNTEGGAHHWEIFQTGDQTYIAAVANYGPTEAVPSKVYKLE